MKATSTYLKRFVFLKRLLHDAELRRQNLERWNLIRSAEVDARNALGRCRWLRALKLDDTGLEGHIIRNSGSYGDTRLQLRVVHDNQVEKAPCARQRQGTFAATSRSRPHSRSVL